MTNTAEGLPKTLPRRPIRQQVFPYFCLFLLGLMMALPLQPVRVKPLTPFYSEWLALALGLGASVALLAYNFWENLSAPRIAVHLVGLMGLIAIQAVFIEPTYTAQALLPLLYLAWAILLAVLVTWLREHLDLETVLRILAYFILIGGLLHALFGVVQYLGLYGWLGWLIESRQIVSITGNIGQQNHFAAHIMLATLALSIFLRCAVCRGALRFSADAVRFRPGALRFAFRRAICPGAFVLSLLAYRKTGAASHSRLAWLTGLLLALFLLYQYSLPWLNEWLKEILARLGFDTEHLEILTATQRGVVSGIEQRLVEWHKAWLMFSSSPLLGVGIGHYGWHSFTLHGLPEFSEAGSKSQLFHHAHNLFMQVLAELGIAGLLLLLFLLVTWLKQFLKNWTTPEGWFMATVLLVLFIHGNLEYPYWYSYFLGILAIFGARRYPKGTAHFHAAAWTDRCGGFVVSAVRHSGNDVRRLPATDQRQRPDPHTISGTSRQNPACDLDEPLLTPWAEAALADYGVPDKSAIREQLGLTTRVVRFQPDPVKVYRQIVYLGLAGETEESISLLRHSAKVYTPCCLITSAT